MRELFLGLAVLAIACSDDDKSRKPNAAAGTGGTSDSGVSGSSGSGGGSQGSSGTGQGGTGASSGAAGSGGTAGTGSGGTGGAGGTGNDGGADDYVQVLFDASHVQCEKIKTCYPEDQGPNPDFCAAPLDPGDSAVTGASFVDQTIRLSPAETARIKACVYAIEDQVTARAWFECLTNLTNDNATCFEACPAAGNECYDAYLVAQPLCDSAGASVQAAIKTCFSPP